MYGFGVGMGFGQPSYVVQTLLPVVDVPIGVTLITLIQNLSASIFVAVAQSIFESEMHQRLTPLVPADEASQILGSSLPEIIASLPSESRSQALDAISTSIVKTFYVCLALSALSVIGLGVRWVSMRKDNATQAALTESAKYEPDRDPDGVEKDITPALTNHLSKSIPREPN